MRKSIFAITMLTLTTVAPSLAFAELACDDANFAKAESSLSRMSSKQESKFYSKLQEAKQAKEAGKNGKCSKLLSKIISKGH